MRESFPSRSASIRAGALLLLLFPTALAAQTAPEEASDPPVIAERPIVEVRDNWATTLDIISIGGEFIASPGEGGFFESYQRLGGSAGGLDATLAPSVAVRLKLSETLRLVIHTMWISTGFEESYYLSRASDTIMGFAIEGPAFALVEERFSVLAVPLMGGVELRPVTSQFSSYVGASIGAALVSNDWTTEVQDLAPSTYSRPRTNVDGVVFAPVGRLYAGMDLRFDRFFSGQSAFRGIFLEAAYTLIPLRRDYFTEIRRGSRGVDDPPVSDASSISAGGLSITFGVNLQFARRSADVAAANQD